MPAPIPAGTTWHKSSFSNGASGQGCIEVAMLPGATVAVRDTKDRTRTPHQHPATAWTAFLSGIRAREFDPTARVAVQTSVATRRDA